MSLLFVQSNLQYMHTHTHTRLTALCPGLPWWVGTRKVKPIWILLKQETVSGSGISCAICKSAPCSRQITTPAPHHSVFYRPDAFPAAQPTASKHWRQTIPHLATDKWENSMELEQTLWWLQHYCIYTEIQAHRAVQPQSNVLIIAHPSSQCVVI